MIALAVVSTCAVGLGLLAMPFGYYTLLRVVLCLTSAVGFAAARKRSDTLWSWVYAALAVIYNPLFPLKLGSKSIWIGLNVLTLAVLWTGASRFRGEMAESHSAKGVTR
jgi:hypothetical protein